MLFATHMLFILARLSCRLIFLSCHIMHVSVFVSSVIVTLRYAGVIGWLGDISQYYVVTLATEILFGCCVTLGHVPKESLLLDLLHFTGLEVRYWGGFLSRHVGFGLLGRTQP